jgi:VRR-NUC domain
MTEHDHQRIFVAWCRKNAIQVFAIPNGGHRSAATARRLKDEGVTPGVPDLFVPTAAGGYNGLFVEMKIKSGRLAKRQEAMIGVLREQGYRVEVCYGHQQAKNATFEYLRGVKL